ncbi:MAG: isoaspartyl peptidase, partial [Synechococcaceae cyanobacterium SM2_3_1]|nr:isoaspartyl peptidase [Synechococcaceae cyanobacterium SM2_3_1]
MVQPRLIIHGGAGSALEAAGLETIRTSLTAVITETYPLLQRGETAATAVIRACQLLEDDPHFNAGTGSVLQSDGQIRMSASLMQGESQTFSGVINVSRVRHPVLMAEA